MSAVMETPAPVHDATLQRLRSEYLEMPGLKVTLPQAARLWGIGLRESEALLTELVDDGFLVRDVRGTYRRRGCS